MADFQVPDKDFLSNVDRSADSFLIYDASATALKRTSINSALDLTSHPVGIDDIQVLTNKTISGGDNSITDIDPTEVTGLPSVASIVTLGGSQTLTNKTLTSPTITSATISNPTLTVDAISEFTSANGVTIDGVLLKDSKMNGSYITDSTVGNSQLAPGAVVQIVSTNYSAVATGTTTIPFDDTIPQNTEGTEFMTQAIIPKSLTNKLVIEVKIYCSHSATTNLIGALFQDTTAGALAAGSMIQVTATGVTSFTFSHVMTAGTISSTTFKVRAGGGDAGTFTFNGQSGTRKLGGITLSSIKITEYKA